MTLGMLLAFTSIFWLLIFGTSVVFHQPNFSWFYKNFLLRSYNQVHLLFKTWKLQFIVQSSYNWWKSRKLSFPPKTGRKKNQQQIDVQKERKELEKCDCRSNLLRSRRVKIRTTYSWLKLWIQSTCCRVNCEHVHSVHGSFA